jgi:hypothetical protein
VQTAKGYKGRLVLPVFRATAVSWSKAKYPAHETELVAYAASVAAAAHVAVATATADADAIRADANSASSVASAYAYAAVAATRAAAAFRAAAYGAAYADARGNAGDAAIRYFWSALSIDATRVEKGKTTYDIAGWPLWASRSTRRTLVFMAGIKSGAPRREAGLVGVDQLVRGPPRWPLPGRRTRTRLCAYR